MQPVLFEEANRVLNPPQGMEQEVKPLYVYTDGKQCISAWELSDEEIQQIIESKRMYISVYSGQTQPPILPLVKSPFSNVSDYILICGNEHGATVNGRHVLTTEQVDNAKSSPYWGNGSSQSTWFARKIIVIATGDEVAAQALDSMLRKLFLDCLKPNESFNMMLDIKRFIEDASNGIVQPKEVYLISEQ